MGGSLSGTHQIEEEGDVKMPELDTEKLIAGIFNIFDATALDSDASKAVVSLRVGKLWALLECLDDYEFYTRFMAYVGRTLRRTKGANKHVVELFRDELEKEEQLVRWSEDLLAEVARADHRKETLRLLGLKSELPQFDISKN